ncbi:hypothetical protein BV898_03075 [Hypsibius exemplaris]|uniref:Uncharacterized protein n=1 Tax=Hypsibius exemplaris TaxID=2072580 RepID=A0A1W0X637_HYPEX|nr:hypothetical protein BV898_03075 [Hypsibius exemplaris]
MKTIMVALTLVICAVILVSGPADAFGWGRGGWGGDGSNGGYYDALGQWHQREPGNGMPVKGSAIPWSRGAGRGWWQAPFL